MLSSPIQPPSIPISSLVHTAETPEDFITQVEMLLHGALNDLESTAGSPFAFEPNGYCLQGLLNPAAEMSDIFEATDEDIYQSVMEAQKVREGINDDTDSDLPVEPGPARTEALQAVLILKRYVQDLDDPAFARKLGMMLGSFRQRTRVTGMWSMRDSKLTSYFTRK